MRIVKHFTTSRARKNGVKNLKWPLWPAAFSGLSTLAVFMRPSFQLVGILAKTLKGFTLFIKYQIIKYADKSMISKANRNQKTLYLKKAFVLTN